ncbi:Zinc finger CCCH domain-containing protein [Bonamia ostreae]|uniref:Zinc finger CCCH domain-containing protein n=1 Tax=Bonamia ostreae TaxID=126728 RepID=A0ABV2AK83_9EUKA
MSRNVDFYLYKYKTKPCTAHTAVDAGIQRYCPDYHHEYERRRNPLEYDYSWIFCPAVNPSSQSKMSAFVEAKFCRDGDNCKKAHTIFENWYHPHLYLTTLCYRGKGCRSGKMCSFAHSKSDLRPTTMAVISNYENCRRHNKNTKQKPEAVVEQTSLNVDTLKERYQKRKKFEKKMDLVPKLEQTTQKQLDKISADLLNLDVGKLKPANKIVVKKRKNKKLSFVFKNSRLEDCKEALSKIKTKAADCSFKSKFDRNKTIENNYISGKLGKREESKIDDDEDIHSEVDRLSALIRAETLSLLKFAVKFIKGVNKRLSDSNVTESEIEVSGLARVKEALLVDKLISEIMGTRNLEILKNRANYHDELLKSLSKASNCQGCRSKVMKKCLVPCGHVLCEVCEMKLLRKKCPFCTKKIKSLKKIKF